MVQVLDLSPEETNASLLGKALGAGLGKQAAMAEAETAFSQSEGDPVKLATAMGRLLSASPDMARAAGPMYQAMLQKMQGDAMAGAGQQGIEEKKFPFPTTNNGEVEKSVETITDPTNIQQIIKGFKAPTGQQIYNEAGALYQKNPAIFKNDPERAIKYVSDNYDREKIQYDTAIEQHKNLSGLQAGVIESLRSHANDLKVDIPANVMSQIEQKAISDVKGGATEEQVKRDRGIEIDEISRQYKDLETIGSSGLLLNNAESVKSIHALQKEFKKRNDLRNFAEKIVATNKVSYPTAYAFADPVKDHPKVDQIIKNLPDIWNQTNINPTEKTRDILPKLAKEIAASNASPQSVFYELKRKGYDPLVLKDYLDDNRDPLHLESYQTDQLAKPITSRFPKMNDVYMGIWGGIE